jgi:hypothetical protein
LNREGRISNTLKPNSSQIVFKKYSQKSGIRCQGICHAACCTHVALSQFSLSVTECAGSRIRAAKEGRF